MACSAGGFFMHSCDVYRELVGGFGHFRLYCYRLQIYRSSTTRRQLGIVWPSLHLYYGMFFQLRSFI